MTDFLLLGARQPDRCELSPARAAGDLVAMTRWQGCLRRWGLLRAFAVPGEQHQAVRACLVVRAHDEAAAADLAAGWGRLGGYDVAVLALTEVPDRFRPRT
jgi:hypothetical protein